jgi:hypothetical protein
MNSGEGRLWKTSEWISLGWRGANPKQNVLANIRLATAIAVKTTLMRGSPGVHLRNYRPPQREYGPPLAFRAGFERGGQPLTYGASGRVAALPPLRTLDEPILARVLHERPAPIAVANIVTFDLPSARD